MSGFEIFAITPPAYLVRGELANGKEQIFAASSLIAIAAAQAGHAGIIDLQFLDIESDICRRELLASVGKRKATAGLFGIKCGASQLSGVRSFFTSLRKEWSDASNKTNEQQFVLILALDSEVRMDVLQSKDLKKDLAKLRKENIRVLIEVISLKEAMAAQALDIDGVIARGHEAAGCVGEQTTFVLLQECVQNLKIPVFAEGGIGLHTAGACFAAGAHGVVLTSQLLLASESCLPYELKLKIEQMDGLETVLLPLAGKQNYRLYGRPNHPLISELTGARIAEVQEKLSQTALDHNSLNWLFPLGQDVAFAKPFAQRFVSIAGILDAIKNAADEHVTLAKKIKPLAPNSLLAKSHGTRYPIVQGAMTRVSDTDEFAFKVAEGGGLPFLALALMREGEVDKLLSASSAKLGNLPWGVGILGFVPAQLRQEQLEVIQKYKPPYALIAGGRPDQAKFLEEQGIKTYLHVPSPLLLSSFIEMGSRRFVFEGRECGGHVGPRSSFVLWEAMIEKLLESIGPREDASAYHVLFAGGVHDALSACMVSAMAAPLAQRGVRVGVLMGTAYLYTEEAVQSGAIVRKFQEAAIKCRETVLLETGPGHAIRCIDSPYKRTFDERRQALTVEGKGRDQIREELELMNLGRLRIASKGVSRGTSLSKEQIIAEMASSEAATGNGQKLQTISEDHQWSDGMYMIGQVASLHNSVCTISALHEQVSVVGTSMLDEQAELPDSTDNDEELLDKEVAIIGMACMLPKAKNLETYWRNILNKVDTIEEIPLDQWDWRNYYDPDPQARDKIYSKWGGFLENIEFDPTKYGIPPSSLMSIDPMQVLLLEVTDAAIKDAGYEKRTFPRDKTSVILANAGHGPITALYSLRSMLGWKLADLDPKEKAKLEEMLPEWTEDSFPGYLGNVTAGRVANRFDLGGVNFSIDAACASSLAALHTAVAELRNGNSDVVLLAAADTHNQPGDYLSFSKTHAFSADGRCKTFDAQADGIVISEGMAVLVLKRLSAAKRDGDRVYAVIKGVGGSSDGRDLSLTAPRPAGQVKALVRAYQDAGVAPSTVTLIEAHGTGTVAGDKAEVEALKQVFEKSGARQQSCALGSVKTMIGHTKAAAGLASLIKVAKALHHKVLPPTIGVKVPNPSCHFEEGPFYINSETRPWLADDGEKDVRRAGVSAFGFGGTNFHAVLEEYVPESALTAGDALDLVMPAELFLLYGRNQAELLKTATSLSDSLKRLGAEERTAEHALAALAYSYYLKSLEWQTVNHKIEGQQDLCLAVVASSITDLEEKLNKVKEDLADSSKSEIKDPKGIYFCAQPKTGKTAFLFPGQGSQHLNMLADLALLFLELKNVFENANVVLKEAFAKPLSEYIYPPPAFTSEEETRYKDELMDTRVVQPAIGVADVAMLKLLMSFGVKPNMVAGHSYGEYVALYTAGSLSFVDLMKISAERGRLLAKRRVDFKGAMAAVSCSSHALNEILAEFNKNNNEKVSIANINSPNQCVIAGAEDALEQAIAFLKGKELSAKRIPVSQAFHSPHMEHAFKDLKKALSEIKFEQSTIPVYSNIDGMVYSPETSNFVKKLANHIVTPVDFVTEIKNMHADGADVFIEVGPGSVLTGLVESILKDTGILALASDRSGRHGVVNLLHVLGQLASRGIKVDPRRLYLDRALYLSKRLSETVTAAGNETASKSKKLTYLVNSANIKRVDKNIIQPQPGKISAPALKANSDSAKPTVMQQPYALAKSGSVTGPSSDAKKGVSKNVDQVMLEFQQSMLQMTNNFLQTQQKVMLAYLQSQQAARGQTNQLDQNTYADNLMTELQSLVGQTNVALPTFDQEIQTTFRNEPTRSIASSNVKVVEQMENAIVQPITQVITPSNTSVQESKNEEVSADFLVTALLDIVSQRTGYPTDMLDPTLDMEADLGIDSIKRVEILNSFRKILPKAKQKQLEAGIEELAGTKTLQGIIDWLKSGASTTQTAAPVTLAKDDDNGNGKHSDSMPEVALTNIKEIPASGGNGNNGASSNNGSKDHEAMPSTGTNIKRAVVKVVPLPAVTDVTQNNEHNSFNNKLVLITDDNHKLSESVAKVFEENGLVPVILTHDRDAVQSEEVSPACLSYKLNLTNSEHLAQLLKKLQNTFGAVSSIVHLQSFGATEDQFTDRSTVSDSAIALLLLIKHLGADITKEKVPFTSGIIAATSMGGNFGLGQLDDSFSPLQASVSGIVKTASREYTLPNCKVVDFQKAKSKTDIQLIAYQLFKELSLRDQIVEIGYQDGNRFGLAVEAENIDQSAVSKTKLDSNSVVLIAGGARGITAEIALEMADRYKPLIIIIGRSERPTAHEDHRFNGLNTPREIKGAIIEQLKAEGKPVSIPAVEARYQVLVREREIRTNLIKLESSGARVEYHALDVRNHQAFSGLIEDIYTRHGNINAVIYGAGVIEDAFIKDKTVESFARVFETKVLGALTLAENLRLETLDHLILFSSVVGRTGNAGQSDYVAANEVMNKLALLLQKKTQGQVTSIMWGPWKGGMAQPELESIFASYGWAMIDPVAGRRVFMEELLYGKDAEVLLVAEVDRPTLIEPQGAKLHQAKLHRLSNGDYEFAFETNTRNDIFLADHTLDGTPVLPMAFALEFMCEAVTSLYPDLQITTIENLDIPAGVIFDTESKMIYVAVQEENHSVEQVQLNVSLSSGVKQKRLNFRARFTLTDGTSVPQVPNQIPTTMLLNGTLPDIGELVAVPSVKDIYKQWFFHGPIFHGIKEVYAVGLKGVLGLVAASNTRACFENNGVENWQIDPVMLDCAMQLSGVWARRHLDITVLPTGFKRLTKFASIEGEFFATRVFVAAESSASELSCDLAIYNATGKLVLLMEGLGGVGNKSLNRLSGIGVA